MKEIYILKEELRHHRGQAGLFKSLFFVTLVCIAIYFISEGERSELWTVIIGLVSAGFFGMAWSWEFSRASRIEDEIKNR
jgi:hypothetical protein